MPASFFNFASSLVRNPKKSNKRRHHSRGRLLRGVENLEGREMMSAVPAYASLPGAPVTIFLDFDGHHEDQWGNVNFPDHPDAQIWNNVNTPVFTLDIDNRHFSDLEKQYIYKIWQCVTEDFAPFNVNVTTVEPPASELGRTIRVCIGGNSSNWYGEPAGGISVQGSFPNQELANVVYVFPGDLNNDIRSIADAASQEIGHSFGLDHQRVWDGHGNIVEEYNPGTLETAPIMGDSYHSQRSLWWRDPYAENGWTNQDDMFLMTMINQGVLEYRPEDHGGGLPNATVIAHYYNSTKGVITQNGESFNTYNDRDAFIVTLPNASVMKHWIASVDVDAFSGNLDAKFEVYKFTGPVGKDGKPTSAPQFVGIADPDIDLGATFDLGGGGTFMIIVSSHGDYGDLGQYTLQFYSANAPLVNTNPITLPPIINVVCDPLNPVALPGRVLGQNVVTNSQLNLIGLAGSAKPTGSTLAASSLNVTSPGTHQTPSGFDALDEAFAQFNKKFVGV